MVLSLSFFTCRMGILITPKGRAQTLGLDPGVSPSSATWYHGQGAQSVPSLPEFTHANTGMLSPISELLIGFISDNKRKPLTLGPTHKRHIYFWVLHYMTFPSPIKNNYMQAQFKKKEHTNSLNSITNIRNSRPSFITNPLVFTILNLHKKILLPFSSY